MTHLEVTREPSSQTGDDDRGGDGAHSNPRRSEEIGKSWGDFVVHQRLSVNLDRSWKSPPLTSGHTQYGRLGRPVTQTSSVQIMPCHTGEIDDNPSFFIGHEETLSLLGWVLSVDSVCYVGVDDKSPDGLW